MLDENILNQLNLFQIYHVTCDLYPVPCVNKAVIVLKLDLFCFFFKRLLKPFIGLGNHQIIMCCDLFLKIRHICRFEFLQEMHFIR